jgi:tRNA-specific 2-thiouridylase
MFHTIGQRHGLKIGGKKYGSGKPWYVAEKNMSENTLVVVQGDHQNLYCSKIIASNVSWINSSPFCEIENKDTIECSVKIRYRQADQACTLKKLSKKNIEIQFDQPQRAVALGQSAVLYKNDKCLGGGFIEKIIK